MTFGKKNIGMPFPKVSYRVHHKRSNVPLKELGPWWILWNQCELVEFIWLEITLTASFCIDYGD
jgi:hypothetical protein